jgi:Dolichyl-phosphate-mannose-protein mannosyltransferase
MATTMTASRAPVSTGDRTSTIIPTGMAVVWAIAIAKLIFHVYFNNRYGYFRDEFDYMACGDHISWGYVDQPPLIPFLTHISRALLGDSLRAIRFIPALASSLLVVQAAMIARELGGKFYALVLTAVCVLVAAQYLSNASLLTTNCLEANLWMGCAYCVILAIKRNDPRYWLWFGVLVGVGLEEKYSIAVFVIGIVIGLLLTEQRRFLLSKWMWLGGAAAFLLFLPNLLWNIHYHWPFLQLMGAIRAEGRDVVLGAGQFFLQQLLIVTPPTAVIWITGLIALFVYRPLKPYRVLAWGYLVTYGIFYALHGKSYYLSPIYPVLFAAGAVWRESWLDRPIGRWLKPALLIVLVASGVYILPVVVPVFSPDHFIAYMKQLPFKLPVTEHAHTRAVLPQWYSDQFGWKEMVEETAVAWNQLSPDERRDCGIFAQDYGQAGAIDFFGHEYGLPPAISGDRSYWIWGPNRYSGQCLIVLDDRVGTLNQLFRDVRYVGTSANNPYALERNISVFICTRPKFGTLKDLWPSVKRWR